LKELHAKGTYIASAEVATNSVDYETAAYRFPLALVFGREYDGVSSEALSISDAVLHLPMYGMCNSINVSTTASVLLYHAYSKLMAANHPR
jgi:tRNA (guanosine-2'-O-)-methyltransferase